MINAVNCVGCGIVAPQKEPKNNPFVLDESIPRTKSPDEIRKEVQKARLEKLIADLEKKDPKELTAQEKSILNAYRLSKIPVVCYVA